MSKKIIMACTALVAFAAFILPATASAANDPQVTEGGVLVPHPTSITGTAVETKFTDTEGKNTLVLCSHAHMAGTLTENTNGTVEGSIPVGSAVFKGTGSTSTHNNLPECTGSFGNAYVTVTSALCVRSTPAMANDEFQVTGACGTEGKALFTIGSTTVGACKYEATGAVKGTYTTGGAQVSMTTTDTSAGSGSKLIEGGFLCPTTGALAMTFKLTTTNGEALTVS